MSVILVTGGTGFIGQALVRQLTDAGHRVRTLIRPSQSSPKLPKGVPVEVVVASLRDPRGLRAAMVDVNIVFHLAGVERRGAEADLVETDIQGTRAVLEAAVDAKIERFMFISHLGADRASAFPILKAKAIAEEHIRKSGLNSTIFRTGVIFGPNDGFTTGLAMLLKALPFYFLIPGEGDNLIQPLWIEDLITCMTWALEDRDTVNQTYEIGGPEFLTLQETLEILMKKLNISRRIITVNPPMLRGLTVLLEYILPRSPVSVYWLDYMAANRTCSLDTIPRVFNLMPSRMSKRLAYLEGVDWRRRLFQSSLGLEKR